MKLSGIQMKRNKEALKFQECISGPRTVLLKADVIMWYVRNAIFYYLKRMQTLRLNRRPLQNAPVFMHHEARAISIYSSPGNQWIEELIKYAKFQLATYLGFATRFEMSAP